MALELTTQQKEKFYEDGFLVVPGFFSKDQANTLLDRAKQLLHDFSLDGHPMTRFTTSDHDGPDSSKHVGDDYFLDSGDKIRFFFEDDAFDSQTGKLTRPKEQAINKIGHALHELDPAFRSFTLSNASLVSLARSLDFHKDPLVLQSMVICKQPGIGGKVPIHNDSTFLHTDPPSALGFWFALEDCRMNPVDNGCLHFLPGSHRWNDGGKIRERFVRKKDGLGTEFESLVDEEQKKTWRTGESEEDGDKWVTVECDAGALVLIHGSVLHMSAKNASSRSRYIYTFHMIEGASPSKYDEKNWLQPTPEMAFSRLFASA